MPPATRSRATAAGIEKAVRPRRSEEARPCESHASAAHRSAGRHQPAEPALDHALGDEGALHVGPRGAHQAHDVELVLARVDGEADDVRDREDAGEDEDPAEEGAHPPHQPDARGQPLDPEQVVLDLAHARHSREGLRQPLDLGRRLPLGGQGHLERGGERVLAEVLGQRAQVAEHLAEAPERLLAAHEVHRADRRVLAQPVLEARANAVLGAVLEVDDHLDLLGPARDQLAEAAGHGQERAEHEQADRDRPDRHRVDEAAAPEAGGGLGDEVGDRAQERHRKAGL